MRCWRRVLSFVLVAIGFVPQPAVAGEKGPSGRLGVSVGDHVVVIDPISLKTAEVETGPVAWLFPAPDGKLFAPDLVHGKTTIIDIGTGLPDHRIDGVSMPHFGTVADRYIAISKEVLVVSYPDRALVNRISVAIENPWQVEILAEDTVMIALDRRPDGSGGSSLVAVNLVQGKLVYQQALGGDVRHFAVSPALGLMAFADAGSHLVRIVDPATLQQVAQFTVDGCPMDVAFTMNGRVLISAVAREDGRGALIGWKLKVDKRGLHQRKEWGSGLAGRPVRITASPDQRFLGVALANGQLVVFNVDRWQSVGVVELAGEPRDAVWSDPAFAGPLLPEWSDDKPPELDLHGGAG